MLISFDQFMEIAASICEQYREDGVVLPACPIVRALDNKPWSQCNYFSSCPGTGINFQLWIMLMRSEQYYHHLEFSASCP